MHNPATFDKQELIAWYGKNAVAILGDGANYELMSLDERIPIIEVRARGFYFVGVVAFLNGQPCVALSEPLDTPTIEALSASYCRFIDDRIKERIRQTVPSDSLAFLEALWKLHDPRPSA